MEQHNDLSGTKNVPVIISSASPTPTATRTTFNIPPLPPMDPSDPIEQFSDVAPQGMEGHQAASLPPVAVLDTDSHMNSPDTDNTQYINLDIPPSGVPTDSTQYGGGSLVELPPAQRFTDDAFPEMTLDGVVDGDVVQRRHQLADRTRQAIRGMLQAIAHQNLRGIPLRNLSDETRHIVQEEAAKLGQGPAPVSSPVATRSRSNSVSSIHSHVSNVSAAASADSDADSVFRRAQSIPILPEDYFADLETALGIPVMFEPLDISGMDIPEGGIGYMESQKQELITQTNDLLQEIGRDVSTSALGYGHFYLSEAIRLRRGSTIPASAEDFNDSLGMVINALDIGVDEDVEHRGLVPSSWYRASAAILAVMIRGLLRSRGPWAKGRVAADYTTDSFIIADGIERPRSQGLRIAAMATQLAQHFEHYRVQDDAPLVMYLQTIVRTTQSHIERAVKTKAASTYHLSLENEALMREVITEDMLSKTEAFMHKDAAVREEVEATVRSRMVEQLHQEMLADISVWRQQYQQMLLQALREDALGPAPAPLTNSQLLREHADVIQTQIEGRVAELRDQVVRGELRNVLKEEEIERIRVEVRLDSEEEIERARQETQAQISSEKKAWAVAYRDSVKMDFLKRMAEELGCLVVSKDADEECEGCMRKRAIPEGKRSHSASRAEDVTPQTVPTTPTTRSVKLDTLSPQLQRRKRRARDVHLSSRNLSDDLLVLFLPRTITWKRNPSLHQFLLQ
ncbi:hypothetical protein BJY52DRAFT_1223605 [Lactarius psammicola]|nr:hypothetical protein BJY52DRAFT_1223605 [Lactarius psammicola]